MKLFPITQCARAAQEWHQHGFTTYQQFLCAKCGAKNTVEEPNRWFERGKCGDCGHETDLLKNGCNYMAHNGELPVNRDQRRP